MTGLLACSSLTPECIYTAGPEAFLLLLVAVAAGGAVAGEIMITEQYLRAMHVVRA